MENQTPMVPIANSQQTTVTQSTIDSEPKANNFLVILLSILLLFSVLIAGFFAYQTQKLVKELTELRSEKIVASVVTTPEPTIGSIATDSGTTDSTVNWKKIIGKHWSFKVPKEWYFIKCLSGNDIILGPNLSKEFRDIDSECNFGIRDFLNVDRSTGSFSVPTTTMPDQYGIYTIVSNKKDVVIDNQSAIEQTEEVHGNTIEGTHLMIYIQHKDFTDTLTFWDIKTYPKKETIDQILSTFKFVN